MKSDLSSLLWPQWPTQLAEKIVQGIDLPRALVLVPFATPAAPLLQLYSTGSKVMAANIDQLPLFITKAALTNIDRTTLQRAFVDLGDSLKSGYPLRQRLSQLYQTTCPQCQNQIAAQYFVWNRTLADPQRKQVHCQGCGFKGEIAVTNADLHHLDHIETRGVHYHFLLGRTVSAKLAVDSPLRARIERWHDLYTPRNLYAIAELIMKIEATVSDKTAQLVLKAILFRCLLQASNMVGKQELQQRPKRLQVPILSVEYNVWHLFEAAVSRWSNVDQPVRTTANLRQWVEMSQSSLLYFPDRADRLKRYLASETVSVVVTPPPLVDHNRLALSTLWGGWLLGSKAAEAGYSFVRSQTIPWRIYQQELMQVLYALRPLLKPDARWHFVFEAEHRLQPLVVILAALKAGYDVDLWQIDAPYHHIVLITDPPNREPVVDMAILTATVQAEIRDVVTLATAGKHDDWSKDQLTWLSWQSLLYGGLLGKVMSSLPEQQTVTWLQQQVDLVITELQD